MAIDQHLVIEEVTGRFPGWSVTLVAVDVPIQARTSIVLRNFWTKDDKGVDDPTDAKAKAERYAMTVAKILALEVIEK